MYQKCIKHNLVLAPRRKDRRHSGEARAVRPETGAVLQAARDRGTTQGTHGSADAGRNSGRQGQKMNFYIAVKTKLRPAKMRSDQ